MTDIMICIFLLRFMLLAHSAKHVGAIHFFAVRTCLGTCFVQELIGLINHTPELHFKGLTQILFFILLLLVLVDEHSNNLRANPVNISKKTAEQWEANGRSWPGKEWMRAESTRVSWAIFLDIL